MGITWNKSVIPQQLHRVKKYWNGKWSIRYSENKKAFKKWKAIIRFTAGCTGENIKILQGSSITCLKFRKKN